MMHVQQTSDGWPTVAQRFAFHAVSSAATSANAGLMLAKTADRLQAFPCQCMRVQNADCFRDCGLP
jgi:hypothetical protein